MYNNNKMLAYQMGELIKFLKIYIVTISAEEFAKMKICAIKSFCNQNLCNENLCKMLQ